MSSMHFLLVLLPATVVSGFRSRYKEHVRAQATCSDDFQRILGQIAVKELFEAAKDVKFDRILEKNSYHHQWNSASKKVHLLTVNNNKAVPFWGDVLLFEGYRFERQRLHKLGRISERKLHLLRESKVKSICELSPATLRSFISSSPFLQAIQSQVVDNQCKTLPLQDVQVTVRSALETLCFPAECFMALEEQNFSCNSEIDHVAFVKIYDSWHEHCTRLPYDMAEVAVEYAMHKKCFNFAPPSVLWEPNDKAPGSVSILDPSPVCVPPHHHDKRSWLEKEYAMQRGMCPEGTRCKCLNQALLQRPTVADLRGHGDNFFLRAGVASAASLAKQYATGFLVSTFVVNMAIGGAALGAAVLASLEAPAFLAVGSAVVSIKGFVAMAKFHCEQTLGCWPSSALHVDGRGCRLKPNAKHGNSPLWFLPPPGTKLHMKGGCVIDKCERWEHRQQRVGFSELQKPWGPQQWADVEFSAVGPAESPSLYIPNPGKRAAVFNCQPLSYEAMSRDQRVNMIQLLKRSGMADEYRKEIEAVVSKQLLDMAEEYQDFK